MQKVFFFFSCEFVTWAYLVSQIWVGELSAAVVQNFKSQKFQARDTIVLEQITRR